MADVKWIKMATDIFDNRKIRQIECLPDGDAIIVIWMKLLCLAGNINDMGYVYFTKEIPYTEQMLATQFNKPLATVQLALRTFEQFRMIEVIEDILHISNWEKYQSVDRLNEIREYNRLAKQKSRAKQKQKLLEDVNDMSMTSQRCHDTDIDKKEDKDKEKDKKEDKKEEKNICQQIADMFNHLCPSFPSVKSLSKTRKEMINDSLDTYTIEDFEAVFKKAEESDFLKGSNDKNWIANFDWMIKDANMAKILDGNYDNHKKVNKNTFHNFKQRTYDAEAFRRLEEKSREPIKPADPERIKALQERLKES